MPTTLKAMIEAASAEVPKITATQARELIDRGALVIDVRDAPEVESSGKIAGAIHISRGMLEFRADPGSAFHDKHLDKERTLIVYCASGGRAALAGKTLKDLGYDKVFNLGGFKEWAESGGAIETPIDRGM